MITVLFFASIQEITKKKKLKFVIREELTLDGLKVMINSQYPEMEKMWDHCVISVNQNFVLPDDLIPDNAEIAIFPQVSGGSNFSDVYRITREKLDVQKIVLKMIYPTIGAINIFLGVVRKISRKNKETITKEIEYHAYSRMAKIKLSQIGDEIRAKWPAVSQVIIIQRIGKLKVGEISALIACSSQHREDGVFEATRYAIDRLKQIVPVWKKEHAETGCFWVEGDYQPRAGD